MYYENLDELQENNPHYEKVNVILFVAYALSLRPHLYKEIEEIYKQNELEHYQAYELLDVDLQKSFRAYPFEQVNAMIYSAGIIHLCVFEDTFEPCWSLIRKGYRFVWDYFKRTNEFDFEEIEDNFHTGNKSNMYTDEQIISLHFTGYFLSLYKRNEQTITTPYIFTGSLQNKVKELLYLFHGLPLIDLYPWDSHEYKVIGKECNVPMFQKHMQSLRKSTDGHAFFGELRLIELKDWQSKQRNVVNKHIESLDELLVSKLVPNDKKDDKIEKISAELFAYMDGIEKDFEEHSGWFRYLEPISCLFSILQIELIKMGQHYNLDKETEERLYTWIGYLQSTADYAENELMLFISFYYHIAILEKEYSKLREELFDGRREELLLRFQKLQERETALEKENSLLEKQHKMELINLNQKLEQSLKVNKLQEEKIRQLEKQQKVQSIASQDQEIKALRHYVSLHIEKQSKEKKSLTTDQMVTSLLKKKIAIVGGHHNWQRKMKSLLTNAEFMYVDDINRSFQALRNVDIIFLNSTVLNHGFYYKFINSIQSSGVPFYYLSDAVNKERSITEIYEYVEKM